MKKGFLFRRDEKGEFLECSDLDLLELSTACTRMIALIYAELSLTKPGAGKAFKDCMIGSMIDPDSPVWAPNRSGLCAGAKKSACIVVDMGGLKG